MKMHQKPFNQSDEWLTPRWILEALGEFDLDPCAPVNRPWDTAKLHYTIEENGLNKPWFGRVWLNPPFNRKEKFKWMEKMAAHGNGIMLVPASCETKAFYEHVWGKCSGILFLKGRPHFCFPDGRQAPFNSGCTIALVAYGGNNLKQLCQSGLGAVVREVENSQ